MIRTPVPIVYSPSVNGRALGVWSVWNEKYSLDPRLVDRPWLPIGIVSGILLMAHYDDTAPSCGFPLSAHQPVLIGREEYDELLGMVLAAKISEPSELIKPTQKLSLERSAWIAPTPERAVDILLSCYALDTGIHASLAAAKNAAKGGAISVAATGMREAIAFLRGAPVMDATLAAKDGSVVIPEHLSAKTASHVLSVRDDVVYVAVPRVPMVDFSGPLGVELEPRGLSVVLVLASAESIAAAGRMNDAGPATRHMSSSARNMTTGGDSAKSNELVLKERDALAYPPNHAGCDAPRLWRYILAHAIAARASDIDFMLHGPEKGVVRFSVNGSYREFIEYDGNRHVEAVRSFKTAANMDGASNVAQDGSLSVVFKTEDAERGFNLRLNALPYRDLNTQTLAVRILARDGGRRNITDLGFSERELNYMMEILAIARGKRGALFIVTGPTAAGKTSTLYGALLSLRHPSLKICTAEDPIEYTINGISQTAVNQGMGLSFPEILRALVRQAPNVIMVGEIRDYESASIAVNSAMTGHFVLGTLHADNVCEVPLRLMEGFSSKQGERLQPTTVAAVLAGISAQRLVQRVCQHCREGRPVSDLQARVIRAVLGDVVIPETLAVGRGCPHCGQSGYDDRMVAAEFMMPQWHEEVRHIIRTGGDEGAMREAAKKHGYETISQSAMRKALAGKTSFAEAIAQLTHAERYSVMQKCGLETLNNIE